MRAVGAQPVRAGPSGAPSPRIAAFALAVALLGASSFFDPLVAGSDLWWHLASGREIWANGGLPPAGDPFSYTFAGHEWMNHEWFWDALYWALYRVHEQAVALAQLAVLLATYGAVGWQAWRVSGSLAAATLALWATAASAHWFLDLRPHVYTLALCALLLGTLQWRGRLWLWPAAIALWANIHAGFVFGIGMAGLHALIRCTHAALQARREQQGSEEQPVRGAKQARSARSEPQASEEGWPRTPAAGTPKTWWPRTPAAGPLRREVARDLACAGLCVAALLLNPWGWRILEYPLAYLPGLSSSAYHDLVEWQAPGLGLAELDALGAARWFGSFHGRFWLLAALVLLGAPRAARGHPFRVALAAVTLAMALRARRFIPLFGVCAAPLAAVALAGGLAWLRARLPTRLVQHSGAPAAAASVLLVAWMWRGAHPGGDLLGAWTERDSYPQAAVRYLNALGPPPRVLNYYNWGGYLMLHAPGARVFIDGRANTLYDEQILQDYIALLGAQPGLRARLESYRADVALLPNSGLTQALQRLQPPWRVLYQDPAAVLLAPPDSPWLSAALPAPAELLADEPQFLRQQARRAWEAGGLAEAAGLLERAIELDPQQAGAYMERAELAQLQGDLTGSEEAVERGLRAIPRRSVELRAMQGLLLAHRGAWEPALRALRAGLPRGPFAGPEALRARAEQVRDVERRLRAAGPGAASPGPVGPGPVGPGEARTGEALPREAESDPR